MAANVEDNLKPIVDCVAFFYEEGKGDENFRKKTSFSVKLKKKRGAYRSLRTLSGKPIE